MYIFVSSDFQGNIVHTLHKLIENMAVNNTTFNKLFYFHSINIS